MALFTGALTARRYRLVEPVPDDFRDRFAEALLAHAFHPPASAIHDGETVGWVCLDNLLDTDFGDRDRWLANQFLFAALRVDRKVLPSKLVKAHLDHKVRAWCQEHQREHCPASVRSELKNVVEEDLLQQSLPRVSVYEFCWNVVDGWLMFLNTSERANERFRKLFHETFGQAPLPFSPLDFLEDRPDLAGPLELQGSADLASMTWGLR